MKLGFSPLYIPSRGSYSVQVASSQPVRFGNQALKVSLVRLLVVDDDSSSRLNYSMLLKENLPVDLKSRFQVDTATDVDDALRKLQSARSPYTHLLVDWDMSRDGGKDGDQLILKLATLNKAKRPSNIMMHTGYLEDERKQFANSQNVLIRQKGQPATYVDWLNEQRNFL